MGIVKDIIDEHSALANAKAPWDKYHRNVAAWVLPQTEFFDTLVNTGGGNSAVTAITGTPVSYEKSKWIYDMTSLWAIDRLTAGLISLKTPESDYWHDLEIDSDFGEAATQEEKIALENVRDYLFKIRGNPESGFWSAHRAAVKSMTGLGDGWMYVPEQFGQRTPWRYEFMPMPELFPSVSRTGAPDRMNRVFRWSALQVANEFKEAAGQKILDMANDPKKKHDSVNVLHSVRPRNDEFRSRPGVGGAKFASYYCLPDEEHLIGEGGYWDFPFIRYSWTDTGARPYSEGPVAMCIAEIQSLQELAKHELIAGQMMLRPPIATFGKNFSRLNFNPGATNPGLINGDGNPLFAPLNAGVRPDFAREVMESRRNGVREMLYLNLWQILVADQSSPEETATRSMLRAQEKGEMLGPVGISMNRGLSSLTDREIGILNRKGAFRPGSPLEMPDNLQGANVAPKFTSPLDRLRRMGQVNGVRELLTFIEPLEAIHPGTKERIDTDEVVELVADVLGAPARILRSRDAAKAANEQMNQMGATAATLEAAAAGGQALEAVGRGGTAAAEGAEALRQSPAIRNLLQPAA